MWLHVVASATQRKGTDGSSPWGGRQGGSGGLADESVGLNDGVCSYLTIQHLWHAASPDSHTLPSALGWKRTFGSRGRPRSPAHGGKEALTECEAVPLCRPHRTSHLGRGGEGTQPTWLSKIIRGATAKARGGKRSTPLWMVRQPFVW